MIPMVLGILIRKEIVVENPDSYRMFIEPGSLKILLYLVKALLSEIHFLLLLMLPSYHFQIT